AILPFPTNQTDSAAELLATYRDIAHSLRRIADALTPTPPDLVGTPYVAQRSGRLRPVPAGRPHAVAELASPAREGECGPWPGLAEHGPQVVQAADGGIRALHQERGPQVHPRRCR